MVCDPGSDFSKPERKIAIRAQDMQSVWSSAIGRHLVAMAVSATAVADALMMTKQQASRMLRIRMTRLTLNERLRCRLQKAARSFALTRNARKVSASSLTRVQTH